MGIFNISLPMKYFTEQVYFAVHKIPKGKVSTYGRIAQMAGYSGYARHVGRLLSHLPKDSTLPWFRVINSQGRISLKGNDLIRQRDLLIKDGIIVSVDGKVSLKMYLWRVDL